MVETKAFPELSVKEAAELIAQGIAVVIDVNPRRRWASGHLPGALNLDPAEFTRDDIPADGNATLIFYCSDPACAVSRYAAQRAARMGFAHIFTMPAGIRGWLAEGHKAMSAR
ncbi:MAG: rhodanese-like domain-containing protein [Rhodomicrobiaceae bacterium]